MITKTNTNRKTKTITKRDLISELHFATKDYQQPHCEQLEFVVFVLLWMMSCGKRKKPRNILGGIIRIGLVIIMKQRMVGCIMQTLGGYIPKVTVRMTTGFIFPTTKIGYGRVVRFFLMCGQTMIKHGIITMPSKNFFIVFRGDIG